MPRATGATDAGISKFTLISGGNLLLDEPTNDLDVDTPRALEAALWDFEAAPSIISHDRWFLDRNATHILAFEENSEMVWLEGTTRPTRKICGGGSPPISCTEVANRKLVRA